MKGLHKIAVKITKESMSWMEEDARDLKRQDKIRATTLVLLHLIEYMEHNQMTQSDLAKKLGVTPQYIHKLLHGQDSSFRIETAIEYGEKLGIQLVEIPPVVYYHSVRPGKTSLIWTIPFNEDNGSILNVMSKTIKPEKKQIWQPKQEELVIG